MLKQFRYDEFSLQRIHFAGPLRFIVTGFDCSALQQDGVRVTIQDIKGVFRWTRILAPHKKTASFDQILHTSAR